MQFARCFAAIESTDAPNVLAMLCWFFSLHFWMDMWYHVIRFIYWSSTLNYIPMNIGIYQYLLPCGNLLHSYWKFPFIVDSPINLKIVIFHSYVSLPEGSIYYFISVCVPTLLVVSWGSTGCSLHFCCGSPVEIFPRPLGGDHGNRIARPPQMVGLAGKWAWDQPSF